jgi:hypothetical protein
MANIAPQLGSLIRHIWVAVAKNLTSWVTVGTIVALTGFGCCARAASGDAAAPPRSAMNARRFTA